ncbi:carboxypeptidase-like regulatory domain-containing protein [Panacibacter ginsenosidivorans]|uniref:Carboxypeptidase-like regulatory domain-containing protein n=1 Tax=Panacibacter ginsenosidivorans TaxID=1813871 RepID=A0A5B8V505_9BACT|nr:carboxypeptidase-like regulatory domain-containing protein [Panacibacter ginsenosidivorans]QEC66470.1 carboxypeptidase-like regulatory domain-containing protein [Panacibacter ginsenosidivorans]
MKNTTHRLLLLFVLIILSITGYTQKKTITGFITDSSTNAPMANVQVSNLTTNKKTVTDSKGKFSLQVNIDDVLFFTKDNYHFQMLHYSLLMEQTLYVRMSVLAHELPGVTVQASYSKYQGDSIKRRDDFNRDLVSPQYKTIQNNPSGAGAVVNLDHFTKREKSKRQAEKLFEQNEKDAYVRYRFSPELVSAYTGLHGDSLNHFINLYWPDYKWLRQHTSDEDVFYYINDKLKDYYKRKDEK